MFRFLNTLEGIYIQVDLLVVIWHQLNPSNTTELSNEIYTATQSAACGIVLKIGTEYLLGGRLDAEDGRLYSNLCGLHREWSRVSTADRAALANYTCNETLTENFY
ncbi:hypothetical protein TELCIR_13941 [Teladorsagia circumcincta]|uniref:NTR domain-containing protein n=1 Tax=Teladorsagia circumcincta TaxID=45464 RepID=A0A2G9U4J8_TELCI|nr:hypothetical protein TELCIR_13941 [Teladorsagia circumcincta]